MSAPKIDYRNDSKPTEVGWYATLHSWDVHEGIFPDAHYWTGTEWRYAPNDLHLPSATIRHWPIRFESKEAAEVFACEHGPDQ